MEITTRDNIDSPNKIDNATILVTADRHDEGRRELAVADYSAIADRLKGLVHLRVRGNARDPFFRSDLADIIGEFRGRSGVRYVTIETKLFVADSAEKAMGIALRHDDVTVRLLISLDSVKADFDESSGVKGAFSKLASNFNRLRAYRSELQNLTICTSTTICHKNAGNIREILDLAYSLDVDGLEITPPEAALQGVYAEAVEHAKKLVVEGDAKTQKIRRERRSIMSGLWDLIGRRGLKQTGSAEAPVTSESITIDPFGNIFA